MTEANPQLSLMEANANNVLTAVPEGYQATSSVVTAYESGLCSTHTLKESQVRRPIISPASHVDPSTHPMMMTCGNSVQIPLRPKVTLRVLSLTFDADFIESSSSGPQTQANTP